MPAARLTGQPQQLYSFAEAVDANGQALAQRGNGRSTWGGDDHLCTRNVKFELIEQKDCGAQGPDRDRLRRRRACRQRGTDSAVQVNAVHASPPHAMQRRYSGFRAHFVVETWVFDLDNTLYPHHLNLWQQVDDRIRAYIVEFPEGQQGRGVPGAEGLLQALRHLDARADDRARHEARTTSLDFVHQIDHSPLEPNPALGAAIEKLPGRKLILTNGTRKHADAVMRRLEIHHAFRGRVRHRRGRPRAEAAAADL